LRSYHRTDRRIKMRRKRRNHSNAFKAKVALAAVKEDRTISELADQYQIHPNQITTWKKQLMQNAEDAFKKGPSKKEDEEEGQIKELHAKIGKLAMEKDFLSKALGRTQ
jgi:transposase